MCFMAEMDCVYSHILKQLTAIEPVKSSSLYFEFVLTTLGILYHIHFVRNLNEILHIFPPFSSFFHVNVFLKLFHKKV